jgi:pimeloyl-ACP methyl ester carboxylesterase
VQLQASALASIFDDHDDQGKNSMSDFVLVQGAWFGAWCWKRVLPLFWRGGHRAFAVSLTGVGERAHQLSPDIRLQTHIDDVMAVIEAEELQGAVLVGHSYAGIVITGVADQVRDASRLSRLVYVDAVLPQPGECWSSTHDDKAKAARRAAIAKDGSLAPPSPEIFGLQEADAEWVARRQTAQPGSLYDDPLQFDAGRAARFPCRFIDCTNPALPTIAASRQRAREMPGWDVREIATGHVPMISEPEALVDAIASTGD